MKNCNIKTNVFEFSGIGPLDLRCQVSRKMTKKQSRPYKKRADRRFLIGRTYKDFLAFLDENPHVDWGVKRSEFATEILHIETSGGV